MAPVLSFRDLGERRPVMEKRIVTWSYWLGMLSVLMALVLRFLNLLGLVRSTVIEQGRTLWYMSFYKGALLFFLVAIATASYASMRSNKT